MADKETKKERFALPEGRLINHSLFVADIYKDERGNEAEPSYKIEVAFDPGELLGEGKFEDNIINAACAEWGDSAETDVLEGRIKWYKDGNEMAADRKAKGKPGDAYEGKLVIRAHTKYSKFGNEGPGGIAVYDEEVNPVEPVNGDAVVFRGYYGVVAVSLNPYIDSKTKQKCVGYYLQAFQKTRGTEEDKLSGTADHSDLFKPVGRAEGAGVSRRSRRG
jgi:Enterobacter phage Enc34, ssDNA-binding protein